MKFEEFVGVQTKNFHPGRVLDLGAISFDTSITEQILRTPHDEMKQAYRMMNNRPMVNSAMKQFARFLLGKRICFKSSKDEKSQDAANEWLYQRTTLRRDLYNFAILGVGLGNAYFEKAYAEAENGQLWFDNVYLIDDPSRVYRFLNCKDESEWWIYEVPTELKRFHHRDQVYYPRYFNINYVEGSNIGRRVVYGIPLHKDKLEHFKFGLSRDGIYGRGFLLSTLDDDEVMTTIIKSIALIAKYKSVGTKLISFFSDEGDVRPEDIDKFEKDIEKRRYEDMILTNKKHQVTPLSHVGEYDSMMNELDFFRKEIYSGIVPTFLTPWGGETKYTNAGEIKIPFQLEIASVQEDILDFLNHLITEPLIEQYGWADDLTFYVDDVDLETKSEKMIYALPMYQGNGITLNELRKVAGFETLEEGDKFLYQLPQSAQPQDMGGLPDFNAQGGDSGDDFSQSFSLPNAVSPTLSSETHNCGGNAFQEAFKEAFEALASDDDWRKRVVRYKQATKRQGGNFVIKKKRHVGGKIIRLVYNEEEDCYSIFNGATFLKKFCGDERKVAEAFFDRQVEKMQELQTKAEQGQTEEDKLAEELFNRINAAFLKSVDKFFALYDDNKVTKEAFGLDSDILKKLKDTFDKFSVQTKAITSAVLAKLFLKLRKPPQAEVDAGIDTDALDASDADDAMEQAQALMQQRIENQFDVFKQKKLQDIRRNIIDGVTAGKTHAQIKDDIKKDVAAYKRKDNPFTFELKRIVRTELGGTSNLAKMIKWDKQGYEFFEWITMDDLKVRPEHAKRHRKVFRIKDALSGKIPYPGGSLDPTKPNINCRCEARLYI